VTLYRETTEIDAAERPSRRMPYRSNAELAMRDAVERWGRARWPEARVVHEIVIDRGTVRADLAFVSPDHLVAVEIKSGFDDTSRLVHQAGMFRLAVPELWVCSATNHIDDAELLAYLIPTLGIAAHPGQPRPRHADLEPEKPFDLVERRAATRFEPVPRALLSLLWVAELTAEARRHLLLQGRGKPPTHASLVKAMETLSPDQQIRAVCRQLRGRAAFWRADPPIYEPGETPLEAAPAAGLVA
jgi:hypothetical protein